MSLRVNSLPSAPIEDAGLFGGSDNAADSLGHTPFVSFVDIAGVQQDIMMQQILDIHKEYKLRVKPTNVLHCLNHQCKYSPNDPAS